jgi:hypothetical protein
MREHERRRWEEIKAERQMIDAAAFVLRREAAQRYYAGLTEPYAAYALAAMLDELSRRVGDLDGGLRWQIQQSCQAVVKARLEPSDG